MERKIKVMEACYLERSLDFVQQVFEEYKDLEEGKVVRALVEEIRSKKYYLPEMELLMVDEEDNINGYAMFSGFHLEGKYEGEMLILTPVAVRPSLQRRHISRDLIEYGFEKAKKLGYKAVLVEGNPRNYHSRGFVTAAEYGIMPGASVHLPRIDCLMVKELAPGALEKIKGQVEYDFYRALM